MNFVIISVCVIAMVANECFMKKSWFRIIINIFLLWGCSVGFFNIGGDFRETHCWLKFTRDFKSVVSVLEETNEKGESTKLKKEFELINKSMKNKNLNEKSLTVLVTELLNCE